MPWPGQPVVEDGCDGLRKSLSAPLDLLHSVGPSKFPQDRKFVNLFLIFCIILSNIIQFVLAKKN